MINRMKKIFNFLFDQQDTKVVSVKFQSIHVKIIHVKIREHAFEQRTITIFVVFVQQIIPVEPVRFISKISVHHHLALPMPLVKICRIVIDVFVRRLTYVIERNCPMSLVPTRIMQRINVSLVHVIKANVLVSQVGQEISVRKTLMNV